MTNWKPITESQRDGKIYWTSSPYPNGIVVYESKARYTRGGWKTMIGRKWVPYTPQPTHYRPIDGGRSIQEIIGPVFRPEVTGILTKTPAA